MQSYVPVVFCFDAGYAPYAAVSILSLIANATTPVKIYCIAPSAAARALDPIVALRSSLDADIELLSADESLFSGWREIHHISRATYLRLLIPDLVPEAKVIYLDSDIVVQEDLTALFETSLGDAVLGGVIDPAASTSSRMPRPASDPYVNGGVLLMDLNALRRENFFESCRDINDRFGKAVTWLDQCLINKFAEGRKAVLPDRWNRQIFSNWTGA